MTPKEHDIVEEMVLEFDRLCEGLTPLEKASKLAQFLGDETTEKWIVRPDDDGGYTVLRISVH